MENIAVTDWFTKKRGTIVYPDESDIKLDELVTEIVKGFTGDDLEDAADSTYAILKESNFYNQICSDSRLPVCSLFHHSRNTSGIAVCLAAQKADIAPDFKKKCLGQYGTSINICANYSDRDFKALIRIASLLHDIGKPRSYTSEKKGLPFHNHTTQTEEIVAHILEKAPEALVSKYELDKILPKLASKHHSRDSETVLEKLIGSADSIASGADRMYDVSGKFENNSVFVESTDKIFPHEINFDGGDLQCLETPHTEIIGYKGKITKSAKSKLKPGEKTIVLFSDPMICGGAMQYLGAESEFSGSIGLLALDIMQIQDYINEAEKLPMLRGGSSIVDDILENAGKIIASEVCEEAILFKGGGNLLAFVPSDNEIQHDVKKQIKDMIRKTSDEGLEGALATKTVQLNELNKFPIVLENLQDEIDKEKNQARKLKIIRPTNRDEVCSFCFKRISSTFNNEKICKVCAEKKSSGLEQKHERENKYLDIELLKRYKLYRPSQLQEIGDSIAVIAIDGNMMGRIFMQTMTPAEYNYKSEFFDKNFKDEVRNTTREFIEHNETRLLIDHNYEGKKYAGIDHIYVGGDDILLIMNAKGAIRFCEMLVKNISERFKFSRKFFDGTLFENPTVTISCGIAIADAKFPIYFLLETARKMENIAKRAFRDKTKTDELNLIHSPAGTIALTAVSGAMPSDDHVCFVLPDNENELGFLNNLVSKSLNKENRSKISSLVTCGKTEHERLNFIKSIYSSGLRKESTPSEWLDDCEWMVQVLGNEKLNRSAKMIIPQIWHTKEEL